MNAIVLQVARHGFTATAIGPFDTFDVAGKHATKLCRDGNEWTYSVLSLVPPAQIDPALDSRSEK